MAVSGVLLYLICRHWISTKKTIAHHCGFLPLEVISNIPILVLDFLLSLLYLYLTNHCRELTMIQSLYLVSIHIQYQYWDH